jgi:hypothetical protein
MQRSAAAVREGLDHPVVDGDAHFVEFQPAFVDFVRDHGEGALVDGLQPFSSHPLRGARNWAALTPDERRHQRAVQPPWWTTITDADQLATVSLPRLYSERLDDLGFDFAVCYPSHFLGLAHIDDDEARRGLCRLFNEFVAEFFGPYRDRIEVPAAIPLNDPQEGIEALHHARALGAKIALIPSFVVRPIEHLREQLGDSYGLLGSQHGKWLDAYGLDSQHDYDPFWAAAVELGMPVVGHSPSMGFLDRRSVSNFVFNHMGHFTQSGLYLCKSLFLGGVTQRFPELRVGLLEGGCAVAAQLYTELLSHWEKRGGGAVEQFDPDLTDRTMLRDRFEQYGAPMVRPQHLDGMLESGGRGGPAAEARDDFSALRVDSAADLRDAFVDSFFFGCEADDPLVFLAWHPGLPLGARLQVGLGSDIGHWDVPDIGTPLVEAAELVEHGILTPEQFREFTFDNQVRFYAGADATFFDGTSVEAEARTVLRPA